MRCKLMRVAPVAGVFVPVVSVAGVPVVGVPVVGVFVPVVLESVVLLSRVHSLRPVSALEMRMRGRATMVMA